MRKGTELRITPEPPDGEREAILGVVRELLHAEAERARPSDWTLAGWRYRRTGISDLGPQLDDDRRWVLSARMPWGGREFPGLHGRGDAK